jgi:hypothetical protein
VHADFRPPHARTTAVLRSAGAPVSQNSAASDPLEVDVDLGEPELGRRSCIVIDEAGGLSEVRASGIPRKEVIQPQLPLRLPCYDFTPIIDPTFDGCLPEG